MKKSKDKKEFIFLIDKNNNWIEKYLYIFLKKLTKKYSYSVFTNTKYIKNKTIFVISYTKVLKQSFLDNNKDVLIIHPSKLPLDRGFSPVQNQVLRNQKKIHISMFKASKKVDTGPVCFRDTFLLKGDELNDEIRIKQSNAIFKIIKKYIQKYPNIKYLKQRGLSTYNKKRKISDNVININKSIKSQFNLLRIVDNKLYPAHFKYKKKAYILKIYKQK
jgi:methionyl-tRNA formyltransferase